MEGVELIKLMDYARESGITIQTLGRKLKRYSKELDGHIITEGRTRFLDKEAVAFLDSKRGKGAMSVVVKDSSKEVEALKDKISELEGKLNTSYEMLLTERQKYTNLLEEHTALQLSIAQKGQAAEAEDANESDREQDQANQANASFASEDVANEANASKCQDNLAEGGICQQNMADATTEAAEGSETIGTGTGEEFTERKENRFVRALRILLHG
jgi:TolA-binding protein